MKNDALFLYPSAETKKILFFLEVFPPFIEPLTDEAKLNLRENLVFARKLW